MGYASLLFCADEKTTRLLTQVLKDLEFSVESASEAFVAVKSLMAQHFDVLVVDCDNEQNAALIYKSAKNSTANANSLAVAVVDGHGGIAKAFRIGANLVLTKPINVEQSKGTLRVARGLLRKAEANRAATPAPASAPAPIVSSTSTTQPEVQESTPSLVPLVTASAAAAAPAPAKAQLPASPLEVEQEPTPKLGPAEAGVIESIPDPILRPSKKEKQGAESSSQTGSSPAPAASKAPAPEVTPPAAAIAEPKGKDKDKGKDKRKQEKQEDSKAAASAKAEEKTEKPAAPGKNSLESAAAAAAPRFSSVGVTQEEETFDPATSRKNFIIAAIIVLIAAVGGYFGWARYHPTIKLPFFQEQPAPPASEFKSPSVPKPSPEAPALQAETGQDAVQSAAQTGAPLQADGTNSAAAKDAGQPANGAKPAASDQTAPASPAAPTVPVGRPLKLSQSVAEGLLISKVPPAYPEQAKQLKLEGPVQLEARIGKDGSISYVKAISGNDLLAHAATEAVRKWKYKPYVVNGQPVDIATRITVDFKLP